MSFYNRLLRLYWRLERVIDPGVPSSQNRYGEQLRTRLIKGSAWIDLGCGHSVLPDWIVDQDEIVRNAALAVGFDYSWASIRKHRQIRDLVAGDIAYLPFASASFDLVSANMVVEHLSDPLASLQEIHRILKPGGVFLFHTVNRYYYMAAIARMLPEVIKKKIIWFIERRVEDDVFATHYRLNDESRIRSFAANAGLQVQSVQALNTSSAGLILTGPFAVVDLLFRRFTRANSLRKLRSNYIVVLTKLHASAAAQAG